MDDYSFSVLYFFHISCWFWCSNCPRLGSWEPLQAGSCVLASLFQQFFTLQYKMFWAPPHPSLSLGTQHFSMLSFSVIWFLETKTWVLDVLIAIGVLLLPGPRVGRARNMCMYKHVHTLLHLYLFLYWATYIENSELRWYPQTSSTPRGHPGFPFSMFVGNPSGYILLVDEKEENVMDPKQGPEWSEQGPGDTFPLNLLCGNLSHTCASTTPFIVERRQLSKMARNAVFVSRASRSPPMESRVIMWNRAAFLYGKVNEWGRNQTGKKFYQMLNFQGSHVQ